MEIKNYLFVIRTQICVLRVLKRLNKNMENKEGKKHICIQPFVSKPTGYSVVLIVLFML